MPIVLGAGIPGGPVVDMNDAERPNRGLQPAFLRFAGKVSNARSRSIPAIASFLLYRFYRKFDLDMAPLLHSACASGHRDILCMADEARSHGASRLATLSASISQPGLFGVAQFSYGVGLPVYSQPMAVGAYRSCRWSWQPWRSARTHVDRVPAALRLRCLSATRSRAC